MHDVILHIPQDLTEILLSGEEAVKVAALLLDVALQNETWDTLETSEKDKLAVSANFEQWAARARAFTEEG